MRSIGLSAATTSAVRSQRASHLPPISDRWESGRDFGALAGDRGIGTISGSQDQAAILCSRPGALVQYAFCPLFCSEGVIALPANHSFVIASSGVIAEKSAGAQASYNEIAERAAAIVEIWNEHHSRNDITLGDVISSSPGAVDGVRSVLRALRTTHVFSRGSSANASNSSSPR